MDRLNSLITRWISRHMLLKMAFSPEEVRAMAAQTPFGTCEVKLDRIGMKVTLQK
jgi:hypothetical protein